MTVTVRIVGAGVDTLYASARGTLREGLLEGFADMHGAAGERRDVFGPPPVVIPSPIDVYADTQGWVPAPEDFRRFVCRGVRRTLYEQPGRLHGQGRRLSGFTFGKGGIVARIYDKRLEMGRKGTTWPTCSGSGTPCGNRRTR